LQEKTWRESLRIKNSNNKGQKIVLCGFMGAGKTSVFNALRTIKGLANYSFYDSDEELKKIFNVSSIDSLVSQFGWGRFREVEQEVVFSALDENERLLLALGGGSLSEAVLRGIRDRQGELVWLKVEFSEMIDRLKAGQLDRPLLNELTLPELVKLYKEREKIYAKADIIIDNSNLQRTTDKLLEFLKRT
jgi:shikimate kinase